MWTEDRFGRLKDYKERERGRNRLYKLMQTCNNEEFTPKWLH